MGYSGIETSNCSVPENSLFVEINTPEAKQCDGDFDGDNDADGSDLAALMTELNVCNSTVTMISTVTEMLMRMIFLYSPQISNRDCR